jgi:hypothetical protein
VARARAKAAPRRAHASQRRAGKVMAEGALAAIRRAAARSHWDRVRKFAWTRRRAVRPGDSAGWFGGWFSGLWGRGRVARAPGHHRVKRGVLDAPVVHT